MFYAALMLRRRHVSLITSVIPRNAYNWPYYSIRRGSTNSLTLSDSQRKTIYALSTPMGKAGVGVVRISGPEAMNVWKTVVKIPTTPARQVSTTPEPWKMHRCHIVHPRNGETLDDALAVFFRAPRSFTTEDVLELHIHSGRAIISSVLDALSCLPTCRPAEPGEFTRRAFNSGRLDLTQVEGLKDMIDADTESQRRIAVTAASGAHRVRYEEIRSEIIQCLALVEALIDFGEGEDIEEGVFQQAKDRAIKLSNTIQSHLSDNRRGELLRSGIKLAIFGPPNAGKSTFLNFLAQREAAIVTPVPGTTRDILELSLDIGGIPVIVSDTAGLRHTADLVEEIGIARAKKAVENADIAICVLSLPDSEVDQKTGRPILQEEVRDLVDFEPEKMFFLLNKSDLAGSYVTRPSSQHDTSAKPLNQTTPKPRLPSWSVSLSTGDGCAAFMDGFTQALREKYDIFTSEQGELSGHAAPLITHARHRVHLQSALEFLKAFLETRPEDVVLGAEELRYAAQAVGKVSGLIDKEDVLDVVFSEFCIGK